MKNKLNTPLKKVILAVLTTVAIIGLVWGGMLLLRNARRQAVNVFAVTDFITTDSGSDTVESSGVVTTDKLQKIYISDSQTVKAIYVTEGQTVRKGNKLISFDTTLSDLDLKRAQIAQERAEQTRTHSKNELDALKKAKNKETLEAEKKTLEAQIADQIKKEEESGQREKPDHDRPTLPLCYNSTIEVCGTKENPYYFLYDGVIPQTEMTALMNTRHPYSASSPSESPIYALLVTWDKALEEYQSFQAITMRWQRITASPTETPPPEENIVLLQTSLTDEALPLPNISKKTIPSSNELAALEKKLAKVNFLLEESYTHLELQRMIAAAEKAFKADDTALKLAQMNLKKIQAEVNDGVIYAQIDGVVKTVRDASVAYNESNAVVEVSGGGGYLVTGSVSEMSLGTVQIGQTVSVNNWMTGISTEGQVIEIGEYPSGNAGWSNGNNNVSWYPFKISVNEDANLQEGDYVNISYQSADADGTGLFLQNPFIRSENGRSYVMVRGEDDRLEQRFVQTGRVLWGSYTQILSGLTQEDYIAFPYGKDTVAGAKTQEASSDALYNTTY